MEPVKVHRILTFVSAELFYLFIYSKLKLVVYISLYSKFLIQVFINEVDNDQASQALDVILNYIKKNPALGISIQLMQIEGNRTDSKKFLENSKYLRSRNRK